ncbi:hypothetical protein BRD00_03335 [Halobacteriales archaeon QS_8_69_26]|nr:MAG: hypothetical protein BRD00_03335 [Halobacteriales archaeon QS_8_69_26]
MYDGIADLPVRIDSVELSTLERETSSDFTRVSTVIEFHGDGATGRGEDVTYDAGDHRTLVAADPDWGLTGEWTFDEFSAHLDDVDLFPEPPESETARHYRRWGVESAALDLALRQAGESLGSVLDRTYDPVRFVASTRLGDPPTIDRVEEFLSVDPTLEFKLDPTPGWTPDLIDRLADTGRVRVLDLKGAYEGTSVDNPPDPDLYGRVLAGFPDAVVEDPALTDDTRPLFDGHRDRVAWDHPITGVESVESLPFEPSWLNVKPSRFGTVESLLATISYCEERGIRTYGGGQFELGPGRDQIQALAALFYPDAPNDVAPSAYNDPEISGDLPSSPLDPPEDVVGIGW